MSARDHIILTVFPFENLSLEKDLSIFCRSFSADLITELSRFRQFQVINLPVQASNSSSSSEGLLDPWGTDYFIQGSFRCEKETIRINVQLYNSHTQHMVWGNRLEGNLADLGEIQDNLLLGVVGVLQHQINYDLLSSLRKRQKVEFRAYEHWLYGMEEVKRGSVENDLAARDHFQKALQIQPDYSLAYTGMSLTYFNEWSCQLWDRWEVSKTGAYEWAQKAIEVDDRNYIAAMVLGKIFMYESAYDTAEFYFRKSLLLNSNDPDTHVHIALCFVWLGLEKEGLTLYEKAIHLHPFNAEKYFLYGVFLYFELGEYEKAASLIKQVRNAKMASADAYFAATYFYLDQHDKMQLHWNLFLDTYRKLISKTIDADSREAIDWIMKTNPYKHKTNLEGFLRYISNGNFEIKYGQKSQPGKDTIARNYFLKETVVWKLSYDGFMVQIPELKGLNDIQKLIIQPRQVFHCAELMGSSLDSKGEKLIDEKARRQFQKKILELQNDIQEAEQCSDLARLEKLQEEYDRFVDYLSKSLGLKGRTRETGSTVEKARAAVTWRIRKAIARIEQHHPLLGAHLSNSIKTGTLCSYQPDRDINWITS